MQAARLERQCSGEPWLPHDPPPLVIKGSARNDRRDGGFQTEMAIEIETASGLPARPLTTGQASRLSAVCTTSYCFYWQEWQDSNLQPPVLETGALAIELHSSESDAADHKGPPRRCHAL